MTAWSIPPIFFQDWFWLVVVAGLLVAVHVVRKRYPPPFPRICSVLGRHRKTIMKAMDVALISVVLLYSAIVFNIIRHSHIVRGVASVPEDIRRYDIALSLMAMVVWSGLTGPALGFLSYFQSRLTRFKRVVLLILCLLPAIFAMMALLADSPENWRSVVQLGIILSVPGWVVNGPGALTGRPSPDVLWWIMCKLRLASGDLPD